MSWDIALIFVVLGVILPWRGRARLKKLLAMPHVGTMERLVLYASTIGFQWLAVAVVGWGLWTLTHRAGIDPALAINYGSYDAVVRETGVGAFGNSRNYEIVRRDHHTAWLIAETYYGTAHLLRTQATA